MPLFCTDYDYDKEYRITDSFFVFCLHNMEPAFMFFLAVLCYSSICIIICHYTVKYSMTGLRKWGCHVGCRHCLNIGVCLQSSSLSLKALEGATSAGLAEIEQIVKERMVCCLVSNKEWMHFYLLCSDSCFCMTLKIYWYDCRIIYAPII
jgi:hypothetical protein